MSGLCTIYEDSIDCTMTTHIALFISVHEILSVDLFLRNTSERFLLSLSKQHSKNMSFHFN